MTYIDVMEAIASRIAGLWPKRMLYRDFCPVEFRRPSGFLYVQEAGYTDVTAGLVRWAFRAQLMLYAETDVYSIESTEALRGDQAAVLALFGGPAIAVGDRHITLAVTADTPDLGTAFVSFSAAWVDERPGYRGPETEGAPLMERYELNVGRDGRNPSVTALRAATAPIKGAPQSRTALWGEEKQTERSGYPAKAGCSGVQFVPTMGAKRCGGRGPAE